MKNQKGWRKDYPTSGANSGGPWRFTGTKITATNSGGGVKKSALGGRQSEASMSQMKRMYRKGRYK